LAVWSALIAAVLFLHFWLGVPFGDLTRDPADVFNVSFYIGFLSQTSNFFWATAAAVCMFAGWVLPRQPAVHEPRSFLFYSGLLTLLFALDDSFLIHDRIIPRLGIPETVTYLGYAGLVLLYFVRFGRAILKTEYVLLGMALVFFGTSILLDVLEPPGLDIYLFEDAAKLAGILCWLAYFFRVGGSAVSNSLAPRDGAPVG